MLGSFLIGGFFVFILWLFTDTSYKNKLKMKAKRHEVENIDGEFITLVPEKEYVEMRQKAFQFDQRNKSI